MAHWQRGPQLATRTSACRIAALVVAVPAMLVSPTTALAATAYVGSEAQFQRAVSAFSGSGGRVVLLPHAYRTPLVVGPRSAHRLTIVGMRGARVQNLLLAETRSVTVEHLTVSPLGADSRLVVSRSAHVVLSGLTVTAAGTRRIVELQLDHSNGVTVRDSSFTHCGDRSPQWSFCLLPQLATHVLIENNRFHDCRGCDFIHGYTGLDTTIRDNRFARALACLNGTVKCLHQDLIELFSGNGLVITRNRFGISQRGAAQLYLTNAVNDVRIANNFFRRSDPRAPGVHPPVGIMLGAAVSPHLPHHVEIINNTILSGWKTPGHAAMSIVVSPRYTGLKPSNRPLVANNVLARARDGYLLCTGLRHSIRNVITEGGPCSASDAVGSPNLGVGGVPTRASQLLMDRADPALAPPYDLTGRPRGPHPDIGCYEYVAR
jgi:Right handed beta helix region